MKSSKKNYWLYITSVILLLVLMVFSLVPILNGIWQINQTNQSGQINPEQNLLQSEAIGYEMVLQREPDNQNALEGLLNIRFKQGDLAEVIPPLERLAQINPLNLGYLILLAQSKQQLGDSSGAIKAYRDVLDRQPGNINALKSLTDLFLQQNLVAEAISLVKNILSKAINARDPDMNITSVQLVLAEIYLQQKQKPAALKIYEEAIKSNPEDFRPVLAKAMLFKEDGKKDIAKELFKQAFTLAPKEYKSNILSLENNSPDPASDKLGQ